MQNTKNEIYKHYIALDWAKENFALASIQANSIKYKVEEYPSTIKKLKECLSKFSGKKDSDYRRDNYCSLALCGTV